MIHRFSNFRWDNVELQRYKDEPGTWVSVTRQTLNPEADTDFEVRYFELEPGGYTSYERHEHEHCVLVVRGSGQVRLEESWDELNLFDVIRVRAFVPHQFRNGSSEPFGILCIVDRERDRPQLMIDAP